MAYVPFYVRGSFVGLSVRANRSAGWVIRFGLKVEWLHHIRLSNGVDLAALSGGTLMLSEQAGEPLPNGIGALHFHPAEAGSDDGVLKESHQSFSVEIILPAGHFRYLLDLVQRGIVPTSATMSLPDLTYGQAPDESEVRWELDERPWTPVDSISFRFGPDIDEQSTIEEDDQDAPTTDEPAPARPSREVAAIEALTATVRGTGALVIGLLVLGIAVAVVN